MRGCVEEDRANSDSVVERDASGRTVEAKVHCQLRGTTDEQRNDVPVGQQRSDGAGTGGGTRCTGQEGPCQEISCEKGGQKGGTEKGREEIRQEGREEGRRAQGCQESREESGEERRAQRRKERREESREEGRCAQGREEGRAQGPQVRTQHVDAGVRIETPA